MATFTWTAQKTTGTATIGATDRIWLNGGTAVTDNVTVNSYQDGTHISNSSDVQQDTNPYVHNVKYLTSTTMSLDGAGSANLSTLTTANAPLKINFSDASSVTTTNAKFYAYDGTTDATAMAGVNFYAAEAGVTSTWVAANGSAAALSIQDDTTATSHDYYLALSASPTSVGAKSGKVKITLTYA